MERAIALAVFLTGAALAQSFHATNVRVGRAETTATYGPPLPAPVFTGAPYSTEQILEYNGDRNVIARFARDSQGRTRAERALKIGPYWLTTIADPVAGIAYLLDDTAKVAHRMALPPYDPATARPSIAGPNEENLGEQVVDGLRLSGRRVNGGALIIEIWRSEDLQLEVITRSSNGYSGRLEKLSRAEPDPALFRPPADYRVVDEAAPFTMTFRLK
jgi:hypothetical protein